jgi:CBS domain-containing protein
VISVETGTSLKAVAGLLAKNRISGVPVCDDEGHILGVVSEADIVTKEEGYAPRRIGFLGWLFAPPPELAKKLDARTAGEAMTSPPVTIDPGARVSQAARVMADRKVNRLPVVREGALIGIITRGDLVRAFLRTDGEIREEILDDVLKRTLWIDPERVEVRGDGRTHLSLGQTRLPD